MVGSRECSSEDDLRHHINAIGGALIEVIDVSYSHNYDSEQKTSNFYAPHHASEIKNKKDWVFRIKSTFPKYNKEGKYTLKEQLHAVCWGLGIGLVLMILVVVLVELGVLSPGVTDKDIKTATEFCMDYHNLSLDLYKDPQFAYYLKLIKQQADNTANSWANPTMADSYRHMMNEAAKSHGQRMNYLVRYKICPILAEKYRISADEAYQWLTDNKEEQLFDLSGAACHGPNCDCTTAYIINQVTKYGPKDILLRLATFLASRKKHAFVPDPAAPAISNADTERAINFCYDFSRLLKKQENTPRVQYYAQRQLYDIMEKVLMSLVKEEAIPAICLKYNISDAEIEQIIRMPNLIKGLAANDFDINAFRNEIIGQTAFTELTVILTRANKANSQQTDPRKYRQRNELPRRAKKFSKIAKDMQDPSKNTQATKDVIEELTSR